MKSVKNRGFKITCIILTNLNINKYNLKAFESELNLLSLQSEISLN